MLHESWSMSLARGTATPTRSTLRTSGVTITNPTLLVEVLSPSTEHDDRGSKWLHYQQIPSLQECVLVSQSEPLVERHRRLPDGSWEHSDHAAGTVMLTTGAEIALASLYDALPE
ncbi:MAG: Uma2 family endonuclease [Labilithrix sp.]|nr:Uma2 family endonuclease [Labilithrix sp.]